MADAIGALQNIQSILFIALALAAIIHWLGRRSKPAAWIAATFGALGAVVLAGRFLPDDPLGEAGLWIFKGQIVLLVLFPYLLFRFYASLIEPKKWVWVVAHVLTATTVVATLLLSRLPREGETPGGAFQAFLYLLLIEWVFLNAQVAYGLWRAGRGQPAVTRRRMRTIALGAVILSLVLVAGAAFPGDAEEGSVRQLVTTSLGMLSAPLFMLGFAPPRAVVAAWRRKDDVALREAEIGLIQAVNSEEVAKFLLPRLSAFMGGGGSILTDREGRMLGSHGLSEEEIASIRPMLYESDADKGTELERVRLESGWLAVVPSQLAPYFGEDERKTLSAIGALTDMALARARLFEREQQSVETMRDFVAIASHDLRTPIAVIMGIGATVTQQWDRLSEDQRLDLVGRIEGQAQHLTRLVEDLLTVSKIESGFVTLRTERVDLRQLVADVLMGFPDRAERIAVDVPEGTMILGDADLCTRILRNYLTNAFNYGADPITVEARVTSGWVELSIGDSGEGVPPEFVPRLFEKFARADKKTSKATQGTGLGLSIVRGLARAMGGDAFYEQNRPSGAIFGVRLPVAPESDG